MSLAGTAALIGLAAAATGVAVWAGTNTSIAAPAAAVAVFAAGAMFVDAWLRARAAEPPDPPAPVEDDPIPFRLGFRSGRLGREDIIETLDRIERTGPDPLLPVRTPQEVAALTSLSRSEFRAYVRRRVDDLEERA